MVIILLIPAALNLSIFYLTTSNPDLLSPKLNSILPQHVSLSIISYFIPLCLSRVSADSSISVFY